MIPGWTMLAAKPAKPWDTSALVAILDDQRVAIDTGAWEVVVHRLADGMRDVLFRPPARPALPERHAYDLAVTVVDGELGEAMRIDRVAAIEVVAAWSPRDAPWARRLTPGFLARAVAPT